jgi:hypothetical protein
VTNGDVSPEVQALATYNCQENLTTMKKAAETADDGFEPVEVPGDDESTDPSGPVDPGTDAPAEPDRARGRRARPGRGRSGRA